MPSNPILSLFSKELLTNENFMKWKANINIVLIGNNTKFVMTENESDIPDENETECVREKYERWHTAKNKAKAHMLVIMSETLRTKLENLDTDFHTMDQLKEMFGHKSNQARFEATKNYVNAKMVLGMHVRDHFIEMMNYF
ncbi:uncharacterized protein LOC133785327 [Humulus lupulus]|uniref:uncharacterized protein LOC133785327 n=1 Tax=Humulus lupulus TaxID=3486 RepID=UPI002B4056F0|nr:uncharacterized protein LOC133785327 [Humulus lupulus]